MDGKPVLSVKSLKEQVYEYLREQMRTGGLMPGSVIDMEETSRRLGVSKTPLRDALLQLEMEDFVTILPRRKVVVNVLDVQDIRNYYQIIGALESVALIMAGERLTERDVQFMQQMNEEMKKAIEEDNFDLYYEKNLAMHNTFLNLCGNDDLVRIVNNLKKRLYDFPRPKGFVKEWEQTSTGEHQAVIDFLRKKKYAEAADYVRDVHWSFKVQERYVVKYYAGLSNPKN